MDNTNTLKEDEAIIKKEAVESEDMYDCIDEAYDELDELGKAQDCGDKVKEKEIRDYITNRLGRCS